MNKIPSGIKKYLDQNRRAAETIVAEMAKNLTQLNGLPLPLLVATLNQLRAEITKYSPFKNEPVDCVQWVPFESVIANDYNPNSVAPPEMKLLEHSIVEDGYTQPIVTWPNEKTYEVVDGFHRNRVGKESEIVKARIRGYLPVVIVNSARHDRGDRMASTIRHNRARGKHRVEAMSDIVIELAKRNWSDERIAQNLGMETDEILRLKQISGLSEMFSDQEFSQAWDVEGEITETDFIELTDDDESIISDGVISATRTVNTNDPNRIFHTYDKWECYKAGLYATSKPGMGKEQCEEAYRAFLSDTARFSKALSGVITKWKHSCEHYLTNSSMNRIAWLVQAAMCYAGGIPSTFRAGFYLLTEQEQQAVNECALVYLNKWLKKNGRKTVTLEEAYSYDRQSDIY